jgi:NADH-quinone oxidoreductase subunit A
MSPTSIAAYVVLFASVGLLFLMVSLLIGRLVRPSVPTPAKLDAYECGEPAVGTSFVQFDLRFYVVALVFIVFEVEVALFFPPATIFGTATRWMKAQPPSQTSGTLEADLGVRPPPPTAQTALGKALDEVMRTPHERTEVVLVGIDGHGSDGQQGGAGATNTKQELKSPLVQVGVGAADSATAPEDARKLALAAAVDLAAFFALILLGFAYVWRRGDLNWVRAIDSSPSRPAQKPQLVR